MRLSRLGLICVLLALPHFASAATPDHWVGTWAASPVGAANKGDNALFVADTTLREIVHVSLGGSTLRVSFSNEFGGTPLTITGASVAMSNGRDEIDPKTSALLRFGGQAGVIIPPGALVLSDPIAFNLAPFSDVAISLALPAQTISMVTVHSTSQQVNYQAPGVQLAAKTLDSPTPISHWNVIKGIDVLASADSQAVVTFGDSITDGSGSKVGANQRWPDVLARRLQANKKTAKLSVLNEGIAGNRLLSDGGGPDALARLDRDVLSQSGVGYLIILLGINDIGRTMRTPEPGDDVMAQKLIFALQQIIERAHSHGIKVFGATLTPYEGAGYYSPAGEKMREAENDFIRTSGKFDGVIDFEKMTRDPSAPTRFVESLQHGDHLHPSDDGYKAMGDGIDLKLFER